jgi:hypothetical protein
MITSPVCAATGTPKSGRIVELVNIKLTTHSQVRNREKSALRMADSAVSQNETKVSQNETSAFRTRTSAHLASFIYDGLVAGYSAPALRLWA